MSETFEGAAALDPTDRLDVAALDAWMAGHVAGFSGPMRIARFKGGQSNPTYRIETADAAYVLRRKPFGKLLPSAHAVDREFRVLSALHPAGFPVAEPLGLCTDPSVIGAEFYVMRLVAGRVHWNAALPELAPERRRAVFEAMVDTLAALHSIEPAGVGLGDYGKPGNYFARQIDRWSRQIEASRTGEQPLLDRLTAFLPTAIPEQTRVSVVHGDFRLDNLIFAADTDRVAAVLDWELSTLGDPLADATYLFMNWVMPIDGRSGMAGLDLDGLGIPALEEAVARYCAATGRDGLPNLDWYFAYNLFRLAAILQGIAGRVRDGTAASPEARRMITMIEPLSEAAWSFARKCGA